jgi:hypothetical protein
MRQQKIEKDVVVSKLPIILDIPEAQAICRKPGLYDNDLERVEAAYRNLPERKFDTDVLLGIEVLSNIVARKKHAGELESSDFSTELQVYRNILDLGIKSSMVTDSIKSTKTGVILTATKEEVQSALKKNKIIEFAQSKDINGFEDMYKAVTNFYTKLMKRIKDIRNPLR